MASVSLRVVLSEVPSLNPGLFWLSVSFMIFLYPPIEMLECTCNNSMPLQFGS